MGSLLADTWSYATILIENQWRQSGTGFLVNRKIDETKLKVFLVTNKHVFHPESERRLAAEYIILYYNIRNPDSSISSHAIEIPLVYKDGGVIWREHPERDVDILVFDVTNLFIEINNVKHIRIPYDLICTKEILEREDITIGDEVITIGYPSTYSRVRHRLTNFPLFRSGIIASRIGEKLEDIIIENDEKRRRIIRGFLIDGGIIPGSSGSPGVLKPIIGRVDRRKMKVKMETSKPYLLGVIAETNYSMIIEKSEEEEDEKAYPSYAGLGLAFDAVTVIETIEQFFT